MGTLGFEWDSLLSHAVHLALAYVLAVPIGFDRETKSRSAGLRTFPLVAIGACAFVLVGHDVYDSDDARSRVVYGIITGMGFIGGGAILKREGAVAGTATAASIWNTGAIGVSVGCGRLDIAIVLSFVSIFTLVAGDLLKRWFHIGRSDD
jgi:putative Mg2+ transporter-C (MgtC) family protein